MSFCFQLNRAFELFEDPLDAQAWNYSVSEHCVITNEFVGELAALSAHDDDHSQAVSLPMDDSRVSDEATGGVRPATELEEQLGYTPAVRFEVAHAELLDYIDQLEACCAVDGEDLFSYDHPSFSSPVLTELQLRGSEGSRPLRAGDGGVGGADYDADPLDNCVTSLSDLPVRGADSLSVLFAHMYAYYLI